MSVTTKRRVRCPYCRSLKTITVYSARPDGPNPQWFKVCDNCDYFFSFDADSPHYVAPEDRKKP